MWLVLTKGHVKPCLALQLAVVFTDEHMVLSENGSMHFDGMHDSVCEKGTSRWKMRSTCNVSHIRVELAHVFTDAYRRPTHTKQSIWRGRRHR